MSNNQDTLIIFGAGGHGRVVADAASVSGRFSAIAFLDDGFPALRQAGPWPVVGRFTDAASLRDQFSCAAIGVGDNRARLTLMDEIGRIGFGLPAIVHPSAVVSQHASLGKATVVLAQAVVNFGAVVGEAVIINTAAVVEHDCRVGDGAHLSPGAMLGGGVTIGNCSWIGIGASVRHATAIGEQVRIGAGAAVVSAIPAGATAVGVPARVVEKKRS